MSGELELHVYFKYFSLHGYKATLNTERACFLFLALVYFTNYNDLQLHPLFL